MIHQEVLDLYRCPLDPRRQARLDQEADGLVCQRCRVRFPVKEEDMPCLLPEEGRLPPGCESVRDLPCQQAGAAVGEGQP